MIKFQGHGSLEEATQLLLDKSDIAEIIAKYSFYAAAAEGERIAELFTEEGRFEAGSALIEGMAELRKFFLTSLKVGVTVPVLGGVFIDVNGNKAEAHSIMASAWYDGPGGFGGRYDDHLRRVDGRWLFASRRYSFYYGIKPPVLQGQQ